MLSKTIDGLFKGTYYGVWVLGVLGIFISLILAFANLSLGLSSVFTCVALLCLAIAITLGLLPKSFIKGEFLEKRRVPFAIICVMIALVMIGIIYVVVGGFPELNLLFV